MEITMSKKSATSSNSLRGATAGMAVMLALVVGIGDASAGARGGGGGSRASGGGRMAQSSVSGANRATTGGGSASRGNAGNYNRGNVNTGNVNRGNVNTGNVNTGNVNRGNINTGNINVGNDVNIDIDRDYHGGYGGYGGYYHPIARGAYIGAVAVTTAAVIGAYYYALPPSGCTTVIQNGVSYSYCGTVYYQKIMSGNDVVYVVVQP